MTTKFLENMLFICLFDLNDILFLFSVEISFKKNLNLRIIHSYFIILLK